MKTIITLSFLLAAMLVSNVTNATGNFKVSLSAKAENKALLSVSNDTEQIYEISIYDSEGNTIYAFETKDSKPNFNQTLDFSKLENGLYKMNVKMEGAKFEKYLAVNESGVTVGKSTKKTEPLFQFKDNLIKISHLNHANENVSLHLYQNGSLVWEKELDNSFAINKGFDLSKLDRGNYNLVLASGNDVYEYQLRK